MKRVWIIALVLLATLAGWAVVKAQDSTPTPAGSATDFDQSDVRELSEDERFIIQVNGVSVVTEDRTIDSAFMVSSDIVIDGTVEEAVFVIDGVATVRGTVKGDIVVVRGELNLEDGSSVENITLIESTLNQSPGATVSGEVFNEDSVRAALRRGLAGLSILFWLGMTLLSVIGAAIFAWLGRKQLLGGVDGLRSKFAGSLVTTLAVFIGLPLLSLLAIITLIGIPLSLAILLIVLPSLWFMGHIVFGTFLGSLVLKPGEHAWSDSRVYGAAIGGTLAMQLALLVPLLGFVIILAGLLGAGALVYRTVCNARKGYEPVVVIS